MQNTEFCVWGTVTVERKSHIFTHIFQSFLAGSPTRLHHLIFSKNKWIPFHPSLFLPLIPELVHCRASCLSIPDVPLRCTFFHLLLRDEINNLPKVSWPRPRPSNQSAPSKALRRHLDRIPDPPPLALSPDEGAATPTHSRRRDHSSARSTSSTPRHRTLHPAKMCLKNWESYRIPMSSVGAVLWLMADLQRAGVASHTLNAICAGWRR